MKISNLYKIGDEIVFYSPNLKTRRQSLYDSLINGESTGYDVYNNAMDVNTASDAFLLMADYYVPNNTIESVYRNIEIGSYIICIVRAELLAISGGDIYLSKLSSVIDAIQVGMLITASQLLLSIEPDDVLTENRLNRWASYAISANAL